MKKKHREAMIAYGLKIAGLEEIVRRHKICLDAHGTRLAEHDEEFEALGEGINATRQDLFQRVKELENWKKSNPLLDLKGVLEFSLDDHEKRLITIEGILNNTPFSSVLMKDFAQRVVGLEKVKDALYETSNAQALAIETMQKQIKEINSRLMSLTNKYLELRPTQKKQPKTGMAWEPNREGTALCDNGTATAYQTPQVNLFAVKKGRPRKVK